jgi:hypothetical protein
MASAALIPNDFFFFFGSDTIAVKFLVVVGVTTIFVEEDVGHLWKLDDALFDGQEYTHDHAKLTTHGTLGAVEKRPIMELLGPMRKLLREHEVLLLRWRVYPEFPSTSTTHVMASSVSVSVRKPGIAPAYSICASS